MAMVVESTLKSTNAFSQVKMLSRKSQTSAVIVQAIMKLRCAQTDLDSSSLKSLKICATDMLPSTLSVGTKPMMIESNLQLFQRRGLLKIIAIKTKVSLSTSWPRNSTMLKFTLASNQIPIIFHKMKIEKLRNKQKMSSIKLVIWRNRKKPKKRPLKSKKRKKSKRFRIIIQERI